MNVKLVFLVGVAVFCTYYHHVEAGECFNIWAKNDAVHALVDRCPFLPVLSENEYCCYNIKLEPYCCPVNEFAINMVIGVIIVAIVLGLFSFLCSCLFCKCW